MQISSAGPLTGLTYGSVVSASLQERITNRVDRIVRRFTIVNSMVMAADGSSTGVSEALLRESLTNAYGSDSSQGDKFWSYEDRRLYCVRKVASASYCKVYLFIDLQRYFAGAFKVCRKNLREPVDVLKQRLEHEKAVLTSIHASGKVWGIQDKPYESVELCVQSRKTDQQKTRVGVLHPFYEGNYIQESGQRTPTVSQEEYIRFHQVISAISYLHQHDILSGDIKSDNVLLREELAHLTDFSTCATDQTPINHLVAGNADNTRPVTKRYICISDFVRSSAYAADNNREAVVAVEKARDMFALGVLLYTRITGVYPYRLSDGMPTGQYHEITGVQVADTLKDLIRRLCSFKYEQRPTALETFQDFDAYLKEREPAVYQRIQELKMNLGYQRTLPFLDTCKS